MDSFRRFWRVVVFAVLGAAIYQEYSKDPAERTGTGLVAGVVPYDFRPPTPERIKDSLWNPNDPRLFLPTLFGIGWTINLATVMSKVKEMSEDR